MSAILEKNQLTSDSFGFGDCASSICVSKPYQRQRRQIVIGSGRHFGMRATKIWTPRIARRSSSHHEALLKIIYNRTNNYKINMYLIDEAKPNRIASGANPAVPTCTHLIICAVTSFITFHPLFIKIDIHRTVIKFATNRGMLISA